MAKKKDTGDSGEDVRDELTAPNDVPNLSDQVVTLRLKQNAYWRGEFCHAGTTFDLPREEAQHLLRTTGLFEPK